MKPEEKRIYNEGIEDSVPIMSTYTRENVIPKLLRIIDERRIDKDCILVAVQQIHHQNEDWRVYPINECTHTALANYLAKDDVRGKPSFVIGRFYKETNTLDQSEKYGY